MNGTLLQVSVDMDGTMKILAQYCQKQLITYMDCFNSHPKDWHSKCENLELQLSKCVDSHPALRDIKAECAASNDAYSACIYKNPNDIEVCAGALKTFMQCAEKIKQNYGNKLQT